MLKVVYHAKVERCGDALEHLSLGTHAENMKDMVDKGRTCNGRKKYEDTSQFIGMPIGQIVTYGYSRAHASRLSRGVKSRG